MHFVMYALSNHVAVLHNVAPLAQLEQVAILSDGVVAESDNNFYNERPRGHTENNE